MKTLINRIADQLGIPECAPMVPVKRDRASIEREFAIIRQLHRMHRDARDAAMKVEAVALESTRRARAAFAETEVRLELLSAELGQVAPSVSFDDDLADEEQARADARADAGDTRRKSETEDAATRRKE